MTPGGALMIEHRLIERMIRLMHEQIARIEADRQCDSEFITSAVDFILSYADRCHHGKEEDILFRELDARPLPAPLRQILQELIDEHVQARQVTRRLAEANERCRQGEHEAVTQIQQHLQELTEMYPRHIEKEDTRFFVPVQELLSQEELAAMLERFWEFDRQLFHQHYREVVGQWEEARHPT